jgi:FtsP/CotA-like multicopper oxidase with cupredoxin domain
MARRNLGIVWRFVALLFVAALPAAAQSFRVQCPGGTITHPGDNNSEPLYMGPTQFNTAPTNGANGGFVTPVSGTVNGAIRCQQISGGDGLSTMADGTQIFMFSFGPLSGLADVAAGRPSPQFPGVFNTPYNVAVTNGVLTRGDPATKDGATSGASPWTSNPVSSPAFAWNGAVGLAPDIANVVTVSNIVEGPVTAALYPGATVPSCPTTLASATTVTAWTDAPSGFTVGEPIQINNATAEGPTTTPTGYAGKWIVSCVANAAAMTPDAFAEYAFQYDESVGPSTATTGLASDTGLDLAATANTPFMIDGHVDPRQIMDIGVMNGNIPAPLSAFDEDDEFFLTLTNVGMIMRPDLFEQHTVHFHGYPNASSFYDGVPDASIAINIGASFTYYYLAPDAGTYFWHCHITPPEHLQMGMVGQLYVRPRQDRLPQGTSLYTGLLWQNGDPTALAAIGRSPDLRTECKPSVDILCSATMPAINTSANRPAAGTLCSSNGVTVSNEGTTPQYVYNDGDGSTCYDVTYPIQMHGFDPNFHFVGMTFNPELFADMKDKYFLLNGRSYPDTVGACGGTAGGPGTGCIPGPQATVTTDGQMHYSQPLPAIINIPVGGKASLRLANLSVAEYFTLQSPGVPMHEIGFNAKLLRDQDGNNTEFWTNSITLGGGESLDVILDASDDGCSTYLGSGCAAKLYTPGNIFYVYSSNLDFLSNDAENFGGMMTEVHICNSVSSDTFGNTCN